jgi:hypothetical protein
LTRISGARTRAKFLVIITSAPFDAMWTADDPMPKTPATLATLTAAPIGLARNAGSAGADHLERGDRVEPVDVDKVLGVERIAILVRANPWAAPVTTATAPR